MPTPGTLQKTGTLPRLSALLKTGGLLVVVALTTWIAGCGRSGPSLLVVTLDTLNLRYVSPYFAEAGTTPEIEALAANGVLVRNAYTTVPLTVPSHAAIFTGRNPLELGVVDNSSTVPEDAVLLAELLAERGYETGAFIGLGVLGHWSKIDQGFETFEDPFSAEALPWYRNADEVVPQAIDWLAERDGEPFFAWVHLSDPHAPYLPETLEPDAVVSLDGEPVARLALQTMSSHRVELAVPPGEHALRWEALLDLQDDEEGSLLLRLEDTPFLRDLVDGTFDDEVDLDEGAYEITLVNESAEPVSGTIELSGQLELPPTGMARANYVHEVERVDRGLGRLLDALAERDDVVVAVVSDHGEGLRYHQKLGHVGEVFEDQLRIAWILSGPGLPAGAEVDGPAVNEDVLPTLLEILGMPEPEGLSGRSIAGCWSDGDCPVRREWWAYGYPRPNMPIVAGYEWPFKLVYRNKHKNVYDLSEDPHEEKRLRRRAQREGPPKLLLDRLESRREAMQTAFASVGPGEADDERREALEALGYLD